MKCIKRLKLHFIFIGLVFPALFIFNLPPVKAERLSIKIYTSADGLGSSFVNYSMRDSRGFMWFCTRDGLSRFDGSEFITYQIGDKNASPGVEYIYELKDGTYWIATTGGLFRFKPDLFSQSESNSDRPVLRAEKIDNNRSNMLEDSDGNLWYASVPSLILERDGRIEFEKMPLDLPRNPNRNFGIAQIRQAPDKSIWFNTSWGLVRRLPDGRKVFYQSEAKNTIGNNSMLVDADGRVWLVRGVEFSVLNPEPLESLSNLGELTMRSFEPNYKLPAETDKEIRLPEKAGEILGFTGKDFLTKYQSNRLFQTSDKHIWLTTSKELVEFDGRVFHLYDERHGLPSSLSEMEEDSAGNLWIGGRSGLVRLDRRGLTSYGTANGFHSPAIHAINEAADGTLYFADSDFYLSRFKGKDLQTIRPPIPLDSRSLWTSRHAFLSSDGEWWILTADKLYRFARPASFEALAHQKPSAVYDMQNGLKANEAFQIFEDSHGDIWVSVQPANTKNVGLSRLKKGENKFYIFSETEGLPPGKAASSFAEDRAGNLWISFYEGGLVRYAGGRFTDFSQIPEIPRQFVTDLLVDRAGRLWVSSANNGLLRVDMPEAENPQFVPFTIENGLSSNNIRTLTEDKFGNIYAGNARGVDKISPATGRIKHYSIADGLAADFVIDSHCDKNGVLWFATTNGLSRLAPVGDEKTPAPQIWLGALRIAGVRQYVSELGVSELEKGELAPSENNFQLGFFGLDFRAGETLRYQYKLEGAEDENWSVPSEQRSVTFANLKAGNYRFLVRAVNSDGIASENPAVVSFKILPPVWARWWFILLSCLFVVGIVIFVERYRAARLRELKTAFGELSVSEDRFRQLTEQSPFGILIFAPDGSIRSMNEAYLKLWGDDITPEDIRQWDFFADEQMVKGGVIEGLSRAFGGEFVAFPPMFYDRSLSPLRGGKAKSTEARWMQAVAYPVKGSTGELREVICVLEDVTKRIEAEENLRKSREERLAELEKVRSRIATDLHDDIGASLTQIAILSEVAQTQNQKGNDAIEPLTKISSVSNELVGVMSDIVWAINPSKDHLQDLTQRMRRFASDILSARGITFHFTSSPLDGDIQIGTNTRREFFLVFKESVNNIVKHAEAGHVEIKLYISDKKLTLKISDDGKGFRLHSLAGATENPDNPGGNGILSMKKRAAEMNGEFEIVSAEGKGTIVILRLPLEQNFVV